MMEITEKRKNEKDSSNKTPQESAEEQLKERRRRGKSGEYVR